MLKTLNRILVALGINFFLILRLLKNLVRYIKDYKIYKKNYQGKIIIDPALADFDAESANIGEYFWQDMYVSKEIIAHKPICHSDLGSRVDGFISIISTHMPVVVYDIRPLKLDIENIAARQLDITKIPSNMYGSIESLSCLHTLEHIGLGRYGDQINPDGWMIAFRNLLELLKFNGRLYISVPLGEGCVRFNANRIFDPIEFMTHAQKFGAKLVNFSYLNFQNNRPSSLIKSKSFEDDFQKIKKMEYCLGIFTLTK
jgi:hypothetical protein